jgi:hypothetical protein
LEGTESGIDGLFERIHFLKYIARKKRPKVAGAVVILELWWQLMKCIELQEDVVAKIV